MKIDKKRLIIDEIGTFNPSKSLKLPKFKGISTPWVSNRLYKNNEDRQNKS